MKKLLILTLSVALVLSGCAPKAATPSIVVPPTGVQAPSQTKADMDKIVADYQIKIDAKAAPKELIDFILLHEKDIDKENITICLDRLLDVETNMLEASNIKLFEPVLNIALNNYSLADLLNLNVEEEGLKKDLQEAFNNGYLLASSEGMFYLKIDYSKLYETFGKITNSETADYLAIMDLETQKHFSKDAALAVKPDDLAARAIMTDLNSTCTFY